MNSRRILEVVGVLSFATMFLTIWGAMFGQLRMSAAAAVATAVLSGMVGFVAVIWASQVEDHFR